MSGSGRTCMGGGFTAEFVGGAAGIVLGILALVGIAPEILCSVAVLVFGGTLLFGSGMTGMLRNHSARRPLSLTSSVRIPCSSGRAAALRGAGDHRPGDSGSDTRGFGHSDPGGIAGCRSVHRDECVRHDLFLEHA